MVIERWAAGFASVTRVFKDNCAFAASDAVTSPSVGLKLVKSSVKSYYYRLVPHFNLSFK